MSSTQQRNNCCHPLLVATQLCPNAKIYIPTKTTTITTTSPTQASTIKSPQASGKEYNGPTPKPTTKKNHIKQSHRQTHDHHRHRQQPQPQEHDGKRLTAEPSIIRHDTDATIAAAVDDNNNSIPKRNRRPRHPKSVQQFHHRTELLLSTSRPQETNVHHQEKEHRRRRPKDHPKNGHTNNNSDRWQPPSTNNDTVGGSTTTTNHPNYKQLSLPNQQKMRSRNNDNCINETVNNNNNNNSNNATTTATSVFQLTSNQLFPFLPPVVSSQNNNNNNNNNTSNKNYNINICTHNDIRNRTTDNVWSNELVVKRKLLVVPEVAMSNDDASTAAVVATTNGDNDRIQTNNSNDIAQLVTLVAAAGTRKNRYINRHASATIVPEEDTNVQDHHYHYDDNTKTTAHELSLAFESTSINPIGGGGGGGSKQNDTTIRCRPIVRRQSAPSFEKLRDRWWNWMRTVREADEHSQHQEQSISHHNDIQQYRESTHSSNIHEDSGVVDDNHTTHSIGTTCCHQLTKNADELVLASSSVEAMMDCLQLETETQQGNCNDGAVEQLLLAAIRQGNIGRVKFLSSQVAYDSDELESNILQLAVQFDQAHILRIICVDMERRSTLKRSRVNDTDCTTSRSQQMAIPILCATEHGYDECLQVLLSFFGIASLLTCRDVVGNTALHCCCFCNTTAPNRTTFAFLLDFITTSTAYTTSFLFKILSSRNDQQQTPLHVAAQYGRVDVMDVVLNHRCTSHVSILTKLLSIQDAELQTPLLTAVASGSSDFVMSLQMWRGNNYPVRRESTPNYQRNRAKVKPPTETRIVVPCPLAWAVKHKNLDMISLLLEFNNPSSDSGYKLSAALCTAVDNDDEEKKCGESNYDDTSFDIIRVLIEAGANPCGTDDTQLRSAIAIAGILGKSEHLAHLLYSYDEYLNRIRLQRRQDPKLQCQPESFFLGMECTENAERSIDCKEALLTSLSMITSGSRRTEIPRSLDCQPKCCLVLYEHGIRLSHSDLERLTYDQPQIIKLKKVNANLDVIPILNVKTSYQTLLSARPSVGNDRDRERYYKSHKLSALPWFDNGRKGRKCAFFSSTQGTENLWLGLNNGQETDVVVTCNDGSSLSAHRIVLAQSKKLDAAMRFASMSERTHAKDDILLLTLDLPYETCRQLLIHMYHGSLQFEDLLTATDPYDCCMEILKLIVVADEYMCTSLIRECIQRLLASVNMYDRCFCPYCHEQTEPLNNDTFAICTYRLTGPSHLITPKSALDVLAIAEHISWYRDYDDNDETNEQQHEQTKSKRLIDRLREVALAAAICDFGTVIQSETFVEQFESLSVDSIKTATGVLLKTLLVDLTEVSRKQQ